MKHRIAWEDERMAGVNCYVKTERKQVFGTEKWVDRPTYGGSVSADDAATACDSCGQRLRLEWNVRLVEVEATPTPASSGEAP